jgi:hypothetical protein
MKRMPLAGITLLVIAITNTTQAQLASNTPKTNKEKEIINNIYEKTGVNEGSAVVVATEVHAKARRNFNKTYKNATNIKWSQFNNGTTQVYCVNDGIQTTIFYNKSGLREGMLRYYGESRLPLWVQNKIKSNYLNFSIFQTVEVTVGHTTAWFVIIQDDICWKTIRVVDNELTMVKELQKT